MSHESGEDWCIEIRLKTKANTNANNTSHHIHEASKTSTMGCIQEEWLASSFANELIQGESWMGACATDFTVTKSTAVNAHGQTEHNPRGLAEGRIPELYQGQHSMNSDSTGGCRTSSRYVPNQHSFTIFSHQYVTLGPK